MKENLETVVRQKDTLQQQLYTVAFVDLSIKYILEGSSIYPKPEWLDTLFLLIFFGCIAWKMLLQRFTKPMLLGIGICGVLFALVSFRMKYYFLLFTFCGVAAAQDIDLKKVFRYTSITKILMILMHVIPYIVAAIITPEEIDYIYRNGVQRQYFYMGHPNAFSMYVGWALLEFTYAFYDQLKIKHLLVIWLINYIAYLFTDSNTSLIVMTLCFMGFILERVKKERVYKVLEWGARYLFAVCAVFFTVITIGFTSFPQPLKSLYLILNEIFTSRLIFGAFTYEKFGIAWLGNPWVSLPETTYFEGFWLDTLVFDNSYIYLLVYYGAIFLPIFAIAFIITGKSKKSDLSRNVENVLLIGYSFYAIMEQYAINAVLCFPILFVGKRMYEIYEEKSQEKSEKRKQEREQEIGEHYECSVKCGNTSI